MIRGPEPQPKDEAEFYRYVVGHPQVSVALCGLRDPARFARIASGAGLHAHLAQSSCTRILHILHFLHCCFSCLLHCSCTYLVLLFPHTIGSFLLDRRLLRTGLKRQLEITPAERSALERFGDQARPHMDIEDEWYSLEAIQGYAASAKL